MVTALASLPPQAAAAPPGGGENESVLQCRRTPAALEPIYPRRVTFSPRANKKRKKKQTGATVTHVSATLGFNQLRLSCMFNRKSAASFSPCRSEYKQRQHEFILSDMERVFAPSRCESHMNNILSPSYETLPKNMVFLFPPSFCSESLT